LLGTVSECGVIYVKVVIHLTDLHIPTMLIFY
jgi:hypothetical protein